MFHLLVLARLQEITILKNIFSKQKPAIVKYRNYKKSDLSIFSSLLSGILSTLDSKDRNYECFGTIFVGLLNNYTPMKEKYERLNNVPFYLKLL